MLFSTFSCFFCYILMHNKFTPKLSGWKESFYYNHEFCRWNSIRKEWWDICICSMMRLQLEGLLKPGGGNHLKTSLFTCLGVDAGYCQEPQLELLRQSACSISFGLGPPQHGGLKHLLWRLRVPPQIVQGGPGGKRTIFYDLLSEATWHSFYQSH